MRYTLRVLGRNPSFTFVAILSLALEIGANTAIFSLLNALLLRDLPVRRPERLVELSVVRRGNKIMFSFPMFRELERGQTVFSGLIGWSFGGMANVEINGTLSQADVRSVTGNYYSELGATPLLGRVITLEDANLQGTGTSPVAVLSYEFWQRRFGGAMDVVGKGIAIDGQPFTIIGVSRKWFTGMTTGEGEFLAHWPPAAFSPACFLGYPRTTCPPSLRPRCCSSSWLCSPATGRRAEPRAST